MKKLLIIASLSLLFVACSSGPQNAADKFITNVSKGKIEEAKKYSTEPTGKMLDLISGFGKLPIQPDFKFKHLKDSIVDKRAWVTFENELGGESVIELVQIDGDWKVHMDTKK